MLSKTGEAAERSADSLAEQALDGGSTQLLPGRPGPQLPPGTPPPILARADQGRPLAPGLAAEYGQRLGTDLNDVRIHADDAAAELAEQARARAFTIGSHIFFNSGEFSPQTAGGDQLLTHELAHVVTAPPGTARLLRQPKGGTKSDVKPKQTQAVNQWIRLQVTAGSLDDAAMRLAAVSADDKRNYVFVGLSSAFAKVYDREGEPLGSRFPFKEDSKLTFVPGVYVQRPDGSLAAILVQSLNYHRQRQEIDEKGRGVSVVAQRELTKKEQEAAQKEAQEAEKQGRDPKPTTGQLSIRGLLTEPDKLDALVQQARPDTIIFFVPEVPTAAGGKGGGEQATVYASPIAGRSDGQPANAPPWPVSIQGPKMVPTDSSPTYIAKIDWSANGNYTVAAQAFTQVGESIHYVWEYFNITEYAHQQMAKDPARTKEQPADPEAKTLEQHIEDYTTAKRGAGTDVTGTKAARREFRREFEDWWKDNRRAARDAANPHGETTAEKLMNAEANRVTLELAPVSLLITTLGAIAHFIADLFAGPRQQQEINLEDDGIYLIRVITTPAINEDKEGKPIIRPPSVAGHVVEVMPMQRRVDEALDDRAAQMAELDRDITYAEKSGNKAKAEYLRDLKKRAQEQFTASPVTLLSRRLEEKEKELKQFKKDYPTLSAYSREREVGTLKAQIALYEENERDRLATFGKGVAPQPMTRVNATLISEVSAQVYPLMMTAGPMGGTGTKHRWMINDITQLSTGGKYIGELKDTPSEAFKSALEKFGQAAEYGRGMVGARIDDLPGMEKGAPKQFTVESAPADAALALKRIDDLVMTLAAVGLFVASAGTAGAVIGAAAAAARLIQRWKAHKLSLDSPETISDILGVVGGLAAAGGVLANLHLERMGKAFTVLEEGAVSASKIESATQALARAESLVKGVEAANEIIGYAGVIWGNIQFVDQMLSISAQENDPNSGMTHAAARRARADAMNAAIQNNGLFLAGNMLKYHAESKVGTTAEKGKADAAKQPTVEKPAGGEKVPPGDRAPADQVPADKVPAPTDQVPGDKSPGDKGPTPEKGTTPKPEPKDERPADQKPLEKPPADKTDPKAKQKEGSPKEEEGNRESEEAKKAKGAEKAPPVEDRRPTPKELIDALPEDLRKFAVIDENLKGDSVKIEWEPDKSGLVGEIKIKISPDALPNTVRLHTETVRTMQKYQGFLGRVRVALARISNMLGGEALDPTNKPLFDARLEVGKLPKIINDHLNAMASMRGDALADAEAKLDSLRNQLEEHMGKIEIGDLTPSSGVSARGVAKKDMAKYRELLKKLQGLDPGSDQHMKTRWEMYQLDHGELPRATWEKVYRANVERANIANEIVKAERVRLGWPEREYVFDDLPGKESRRLDLADPAKQKGAEVKAYAGETVYLSADVESEVTRDGKIVRLKGWEITWMFIDCEPSGPLKQALQNAGIAIELRTSSERSSRLDQRIEPPVKAKAKK
jgi:hypothetical protein